MHWRLCLLTVSISLTTPPAYAEKFASIIIDDIGYNLESGKAVIDLPAAITLAILPGTDYSTQLAELAHQHHREVMLHLPLQSIENHNPSPGTLTLHMTRKQFDAQLQDNINSVPYIKGINNHMGSLLTRHPGHMDWLMTELAKHRSFYFIDSRTTKKSVAAEVASEHQVPNLSRDVFLDPDDSKETLEQQFRRFIDIVDRKGFAIAIAHPHPRTLEFLQQHLKNLQQHGISIVPVSMLMTEQEVKQRVTCTGTACAGM